ncbi:MAG: T9SS type A sorting domain-containing protein, partial [Flavobacteriaceae bacterium]|nr:T9SS type A sorting domain-containing protein [Flavobacteriaceae bacterium]
ISGYSDINTHDGNTTILGDLVVKGSIFDQAGAEGIPEVKVENHSNLSRLSCINNDISELNVSNNFNLEYLSCNENNLSAIDLSNNSILKWFYGEYNLFTSLDVTNNPELIYLWISHNQLNSLDLTNNEVLETLYCTHNMLASLNVSHITTLSYLGCRFNQLQSLDVSYNTNLLYISCRDNQLEYLNIKNTNNENMNVVWTYNNPNLLCIQVDDENYANNQDCDLPNYDGWCKDDWTSYSENCSFGVEDFNVKDFKLYPNPVKDFLTISSEKQVDYLKIYSLQGVIIKEGYSNNINVSDLNSGIYFTEITIEGISFVKKFIKN